jgi:hypothetical protein
MSDLRSKVIRLAHANPALRPHLLPLLKEAGGFPRVVKEVEDDYRRKAITVGEKNDLLAAIEDAETEQEAKKLVADHRKGRVATLSDEERSQVDLVKALVKNKGGKNPYLKKWPNLKSDPWTLTFVKPPPSRASARRLGLSDGESRYYDWGGGSLKMGNPETEYFATEDEAKAAVKDVISEVRKYHPGDDIFIMGW